MKNAARFALLYIVTLVPVVAAGAQPASIQIAEYGIYAVQDSGEKRTAPRTAAGVVTPVNDRELLRKTDQVVGQIGTSFGSRIDLDGFPPGPVILTIRTIHPPLTNPATGRSQTVSEYDWPVTDRKNVYFGFSFDDRWEIAEGDWTFQFVYRGRVLAEQRFRVHVPLN